MSISLVKGGNLSLTKAESRLDRRVGNPTASPSGRCETPSSGWVNSADQTELARCDLTEDASTETAMVFGEVYRHGAEMEIPGDRPGIFERARRNRQGLRRQPLSTSEPIRTVTDDQPRKAALWA